LNLDTCLRNTIEICGSDFEQKQIGLVVDLQTGSQTYSRTQRRLHQVFWNLFKERSQVHQAGGRVDVVSRILTDGHLEVLVRDTGVGIEAEALPKIFRAFEQGDRQITRNFGGLGLGLAISKALIDAHGGTIIAESEGRHQGTTIAR
jgi:signal transduction histidine kinase